MNRDRWVTGDVDQRSFWAFSARAGDDIAHKETGETYTLSQKEKDGWIVRKNSFKGVQGGGIHKFTFEEIRRDFIEHNPNGIYLAG